MTSCPKCRTSQDLRWSLFWQTCKSCRQRIWFQGLNPRIGTLVTTIAFPYALLAGFPVAVTVIVGLLFLYYGARHVASTTRPRGPKWPGRASYWSTPMALVGAAGPFVNKNIDFPTSLLFGVAGYIVIQDVVFENNRLGLSRRRYLLINSVGAAVLGFVAGIILGWQGGPTGSPIVGYWFGKPLHASFVAWPILMGAGSALVGALHGVLASKASETITGRPA